MPKGDTIKIRNRIKGLQYVRAADLLPDPRNWRRHPKAQSDALQGVLHEIGYSDALLARETPDGLVLVDGHLRAGLDADQEVPVLVLDLDEYEAGKLLATLDPLAAMAQPDQDALLELLSSVDFESTAVNDMLEALANGETQPMPNMEPGDEGPEPLIDRAEELREKWGVEYGQMWETGRHRLMCGDSEKESAKLLEGVILDVVFTDPPYGINIVRGVSAADGGAKPFGRVRQPGGRAVGVNGGHTNLTGTKVGKKLQGRVGGPGVVAPRLYHSIHGDDKPFDPAWLLDLAPTVLLFGANHYASRLPDAAGWIVWDKGVSPESTFSACELIWSNKGNHVRRYEYRWSGMVREGSRDIELQDRVHPTQKPVGLLEQIINDYSATGQNIFDPYLGSGSTIVAAERTARTCYGIEYEPAYVAVTLQRMADMGLEPRLSKE